MKNIYHIKRRLSLGWWALIIVVLSLVIYVVWRMT